MGRRLFVVLVCVALGVVTGSASVQAVVPPKPVVTSIVPTGGSTAGGTVVTVTGSNLTGATRATFGGTAGTALTVVSATQVTVTSPARAAGVVDVQVTTAGGASALAAGDRFTYTAPPKPVVRSIVPTGGSTAGGTVVTVTGSNLTGATKATFGGTAGTALTVVSATQVTVTSPARAAGIVDIQVTTAGGASALAAGDRFTYTAPPKPAVTGITPTGGTTAGGTVVTVTGSNLTGATRATFGGTAGTALTVVSPTQLTVTSPARAAGVVDMQVTTPGGASALAAGDRYTYTAPPKPVVTAIVPTGGSTAGGTVVTVTGSNLTGATRATFGGTAGTALTVVSATQVTVTSPARAAGIVDIQV
ncbi:MAG TPA: IPT/TIG domain-containing protein, partial [Mycobacterium sp.]